MMSIEGMAAVPAWFGKEAHLCRVLLCERVWYCLVGAYCLALAPGGTTFDLLLTVINLAI
jgi:hypothetical protein